MLVVPNGAWLSPRFAVFSIGREASRDHVTLACTLCGLKQVLSKRHAPLTMRL